MSEAFEIPPQAGTSAEKKRLKRLMATGLAVFLSLASTKDMDQNDPEKDSVGVYRAELTYQEKALQDVSPEQLAELSLRKNEMLQSLPSAKSIWATEQLISSASVDINGERVVLIDDGKVVLLRSVVDALSRVEEDVYDGVRYLKEMPENESVRAMPMPKVIQDFPALYEKVQDIVQEQAKRAFVYDHNVPYNAESPLPSSVVTFEIHGEKVSLHTIDVRYFTGEESQKPPIFIQPGFATTPETYKRMAVEYSLNGFSVTVADIDTFDADMRGETQEFGDLPQLPQAYAVVAQEGIRRVSQNFGQDVVVVAYSLGSVGAAEAIAKDPSSVESLVMIAPTGLYKSHDDDRADQLISDVWNKHRSQVAEEAARSEQSRRTHNDISGPVDRKFGEQLGPVGTLRFKIRSAGQATSVDLNTSLQQIQVPMTILVGEQDAFAPPEELLDALKAFTSVQVIPGGGHSSMKYNPGITAHIVMGAIDSEG